MSNLKKTIVLLGKVPPPFMGPSIATQLLLDSPLKNIYNLVHVDTKVNSNLNDIGKFNFNKVKKNWALYTNMYKKLKTHQPDLVVVPFSQSTIGFIKDSIYIWIAVLLNKKVLLHLRGSEFKIWMNKSNWLTRNFVKYTLKKTKGVIVLGNNLRYLFDGYFNSDQIHVCPNGGTYNISKSNKDNSGVINILYLGNLQPSKGIEDVIESISILCKNNISNFQVTIIGGWRNEIVKQNALKKVEENNLPIHFYTQEESKNKFIHMSNADIFLFPPRAPEGHPWVIVEAMASALPIISTDQGAIVESVIDNKNGFIVPSANPNAIADKLKILIQDKTLRLNMSNESYKLYNENFTEEKMIARLENIFNHVIYQH